VNYLRKRLTYANVMSSLAVFLVIGGGAAFAALGKNTVGSKQLKKNAVTAAKIKKNAVTAAKIKAAAVSSGKLANGSVTAGKLGKAAVTSDNLADGSVTNGKLGGSAVTADKLAQSERSEAFKASDESLSSELPHPLVEDAATLATLNLPAGGHYVVTAESELIFSIASEAGETRFTECSLSDDGTSIATMSDTYVAGLFFPAGGVSMTGISDGGTVNLLCKSTGKNTFGFDRQIVAVRAGSVS
jgi:hypothetical protein